MVIVHPSQQMKRDCTRCFKNNSRELINYRAAALLPACRYHGAIEGATAGGLFWFVSQTESPPKLRQSFAEPTTIIVLEI